MYQPDKFAEFVHKIVSIYVPQIAFGCIPRNQLIIFEYTVVSEAYADQSLSSPRILEVRTFMIPILLKGLQRYKVGTE